MIKTTDEREQMLERSLQAYSAQGWRVETRSEFRSTVAKRAAFSNGAGEKALAETAKRGWTDISMKDDFTTVFAGT